MQIAALQRAIGLIQGSFFSDATAMPLHWIYNQKEIASKVGDRDPIFFPTPSCPYYNYPPGVLSPYGDESLPLLRSISSSGDFNRDAAAQGMFDFFRVYPEEGDKGYVGRLNHAPKSFVAARLAGEEWDKCAPEDSQANGIAKVPLLVARYAGDVNLPTHIESMVRILQNSEVSVASAKLVGKILEQIVLTGDSPKKVIHTLQHNPSKLTAYEAALLGFVSHDRNIDQLTHLMSILESKPVPSEDAHRLNRIKSKLLAHLFAVSSLDEAVQTVALDESDKDFLLKGNEEAKATEAKTGGRDILQVASAFGSSCMLPSAILNILYIWLHEEGFMEALRVNILVGGDNCSRALVLGAGYVAHNPDSMPSEIAGKIKAELWHEISSAAHKIANDNSNLR